MGALEPAALLLSPRPDFTDPADLERYLSTVHKENLPGEGHWADRITDAIRRINDGDLSGVDYLLRAFGGMRSLNDLLIHEANGHSIAAVDVGPVNDRTPGAHRAGSAPGSPRR
jgi:hypothetical protein